MPLISFGTGPAVENETRWEIKEAIQSGHRYGTTLWPHAGVDLAFAKGLLAHSLVFLFHLWLYLLPVCGRCHDIEGWLMLVYP